MMKFIRRAVTTTLFTALAGVTAVASAQTFPIPDKPIHVIVPFTAGGQADVLARVVGQHLGDALGVSVIVETKPGGSTAIGALQVQRAPADGHTLLFTNGLTHAQNPHLRSNLTYDAKLFTPVFQLVEAGVVLIVNPEVPANTVPELVTYAKANPGKLSYASISPGSTSHLLTELFMLQTGIALNHIPYKGSADANRDLWGGQVDMLFDGFGTALPGITGKRVKALGVATPKRNPALPEVPTIVEQGVPGVDLSGYIGFFGPADMPPAVVNRLNTEMQKILEIPAVSKLITEGGNTPAGGSAQDFAKVVSTQSETWGKVVSTIGLKLE